MENELVGNWGGRGCDDEFLLDLLHLGSLLDISQLPSRELDFRKKSLLNCHKD